MSPAAAHIQPRLTKDYDMAKRGTTKKPGKSARGKADKRTVREQGVAPEGSPTADARQISEKDFQSLHRRRTSLKKQGKEISGSASELLTSAAETKNLDKPANAFIEKLWAMSPQKRRTTLACLDYYRTIPHYSTGKLLDDDETGQGELTIPRTEAGEKYEWKDEPAPKPRARRQAGISGTELGEAVKEPGSHLRAVPDAVSA